MSDEPLDETVLDGLRRLQSKARPDFASRIIALYLDGTTDDALWQRHIQINQYGCFLGMKAVMPAMERSGGGSIVNISSVAGLKGSPGSFAYAAPNGRCGA